MEQKDGENPAGDGGTKPTDPDGEGKQNTAGDDGEAKQTGEDKKDGKYLFYVCYSYLLFSIQIVLDCVMIYRITQTDTSPPTTTTTVTSTTTPTTSTNTTVPSGKTEPAPAEPAEPAEPTKSGKQ